MPRKHVYKVLFHSQGKIYEIYASSIAQSHMLGFIEVEGLLFDEKSTVLVDPSEEKLKAEFEGVTRTYVPMHAVIRVDEVEKQGVNKILPGTQGDSNITPFPSPVFSPPKDPKS